MTLEELFARLETAVSGAETKGWNVDWNREISVNMVITDRIDNQRSQFIARGTLGTFEEAVLSIEAEINTLSDRSVARKEKLDSVLTEIVAEAKAILTEEEYNIKFGALVDPKEEAILVEEIIKV